MSRTTVRFMVTVTANDNEYPMTQWRGLEKLRDIIRKRITKTLGECGFISVSVEEAPHD